MMPGMRLELVSSLDGMIQSKGWLALANGDDLKSSFGLPRVYTQRR